MADVARVAAIERAAFSDPWPASAFQDALGATPPLLFFVAVRERATAGYVLARRVADEAEILNLAVAAEHRRRGVGRALVERVLGELRACGVRDAFLEVRESNRAAQGLYEGLGFRVVGRRPRYYRRPVEDALLLRAAISAGARSA